MRENLKVDRAKFSTERWAFIKVVLSKFKTTLGVSFLLSSVQETKHKVVSILAAKHLLK
jgi:hypothetical protein